MLFIHFMLLLSLGLQLYNAINSSGMLFSCSKCRIFNKYWVKPIVLIKLDPGTDGLIAEMN